ncbi:hypothetical protein KPG71_18855 [Roseovarius sp. PS-C2]|uniref:hypothetical protein n=1 Tax=Roseovarius sp. PS-C2 TaxID=2820814 RepID=UPI001C0E4ECE|nr:hypothetical protein [Roseovarius sp. PS-C2]MBU3262086.1 hypothetical protein [Roseovarius sp. PS-C2]
MTPTRQDDIRLLNILHMKDVEGMTCAAIGECMGGSKSSIIGAVNRVNKDADKHGCKCRKKANRDGGMKPKWWAS